MEEILQQIRQERMRQISKFGIQKRTLPEWCMILGGEVGEVNKAALELHFKDEYPELYGNATKQQLEEELIQVAAMCVQILQSLNSNIKK